MKNICICFILICYSSLTLLKSQDKDIYYYLPEISYNPNIPSPKSFLGYEVGEWHVSHDQLVAYMKELARLSDRITIEEYARSYEQRPLLLLTISSVKNQKDIDQIREEHVAVSSGAYNGSLKDMPVVIYQGYSIHGNEASGSNASLAVAYYLAAAEGTEINDLLDNAVILLDPCFNPDGLQRFSTWVNMHKSYNLNSDPIDREYNEVWPGGRTNHYWFDLNRDWLLLQHPESRGRIKNFHKWKPNILTDHHEMGSNATFFFMPGIPSRTNPNTPQENQDLTWEIGKYHAAALDEIGSLYYTKESFDDFYYGKGSTYPDANGGIGILFEQASSRGHLQKTDNGLLSFPFSIRNQVATSFSTQKAGLELREELLEFQRKFYREGMQEAKGSRVKAYEFAEPNDPSRLNEFLSILLQHQLDVYQNNTERNINGKKIPAGKSYSVPLNQRQYRMVNAIFDEVTSFPDSLFYDVSAWTLPRSFDINCNAVTQFSSNSNKIQLADLTPKIQNVNLANAYSIAFEWSDFHAPTLCNYLLKEGVRLSVAHKEFSVPLVDGSIKKFNRGSVIISPQGQNLDRSGIEDKLNKALEAIYKKGSEGPALYPLKTGLSTEGINLGSRSFQNLELPKIAILIGDGVRSYDAGEIWHSFDQRWNMEVTLLDIKQLSRTDLSQFNTLILPDGNYRSIAENHATKIKTWSSSGGTIIAYRGAMNWLSSQGIVKTEYKSQSWRPKSQMGNYGDLSTQSGSQFLGGSIFKTQVDLSHPLLYGYQRNELAVFKRGTSLYKIPGNKFAAPITYAPNPLIAGYTPGKMENYMAGGAYVMNFGNGAGRVICFTENTNFRAFWLGTNKLLANATFFGSHLNSNSLQRAE